MALRVVLADDERPARAFLASLLRDFEGVTLLGEATNGAEAVALIEEIRPDLVLLDLQMPELDGLEVVRLLDRRHLPLIAFVTAYDEYAVRAFEVNAVDYLLKPVTRARLAECLRRAQERLEQGDLRREQAARVEKAMAQYEEEGKAPPLDRIPVRKRDAIVLVPVEKIAWVEAEGELLHLMTDLGERHTITRPLKDLESRLDPERFIRLSRSALARVDRIASVSPMPGGTYVVTLSNGDTLPVSRQRSRILRERLLRF